MKKPPGYFIFRILFVAVFIQIVLVLPPLLFTLLDIVPNQNGFIYTKDFNTFSFHFHEMGKEIIYILGLIIFVLINLPFKIYLNKLRKNKPIKGWIKKYTKKFIQYTAIINAGLYFLTGLIISLILYSHLSDLKEINENLYQVSKQINYITIIVTLLVSLMIFIWQLSRIRIYYLDYFYTKEELKTGKKIVHKSSLYMNLLLSNMVTTFLPIIVILFYIFLNINEIKEVADVKQLTTEEAQILYGKYYIAYEKISTNEKLSENQRTEIIEVFNTIFSRYYNSFSTTFMILGVFMGIIAMFFYIILITKLNSKLIVWPIRELMQNMQKTSNGEFGTYTTVRAKNEVGVLTESYNKMSDQLKKYFDELLDLNKNLENKVIERTSFIEKQKEEIETQKDEIESQRDQVIRQRDYINEQNLQITDSIYYAKNIQKAIIPTRTKIDSILNSYFLIFMPRDIVSGDFYWIKQKEDETILIGADCTGHGVPGAMMSMLGVSSINEVISAGNYKNTADILNQLRTKIINSLRTEGEEQISQDGMDLTLVSLNKKNLIIQFSGAYNSLFVISKNQITTKEDIIRISEMENVDAKLYEIRADKMPVGSHLRDNNPFTYHNIQLNKGDRIYLFSDGFPDLFNFAKRQKYSKKRFKELLLFTYALPIDQQKEEIMMEYDRWLDDKQIDDILIWGIEV